MIRRATTYGLMVIVFVAAAGLTAYWTVTELVSSKDTVVVPDLMEKDVVYALEMLSELGLNTKVKGTQFDARVPKNHILQQDPQPGVEIKAGRDVRLVISKGTRTAAVPNLKALPLSQAGLILEENGLCTGRISYLPSIRTASHRIISQFPGAGQVTWRNRCVDLLVSAGTPDVITVMEDLNGLSLDKAIAAIETNGLILGSIDTAYRPNAMMDRIIDQQPRAGYPVRKGSRADLVINRPAGRPSDRVKRPVGGLSLFRYRVPLGFLKQHVRIRLHSGDTVADYFDQYVRPGREVWVLIPMDKPATVSLYVDNELKRTQIYN